MSRLFVALTVPADAADAVEQLLAPIRDRVVRWVPKERWHLTVEFIGDADPADIVRRWTRRARDSAPLRLRLAGAGSFPQVRRGRVLWVGVECDIDEWQRLAGDDQQAHLTVARSRQPTDMTDSVQALARHSGPPWTATEVVLFDSKAGQATDGGPLYTVVDRFPFGTSAVS